VVSVMDPHSCILGFLDRLYLHSVRCFEISAPIQNEPILTPNQSTSAHVEDKEAMVYPNKTHGLVSTKISTNNNNNNIFPTQLLFTTRR
jgi:hypothetical protein